MEVSARATPSRTPLSYSDAVIELKADYAGNDWFLDSYWPENENRVRLIVDALAARVSPGASILDVGCGNGYMSLLLTKLGYKVTATNAWHPEDRTILFQKYAVPFSPSNLNNIDPLAEFETHDAVLMGEVIEHILNCPLDLMRSAKRVCRFILVLTTPNPATFTNALRLIASQYSPWGTKEFIETPKIEGGEITTKADIHYREYLTHDLVGMIEQAGFAVECVRYFAAGSPPSEPLWKSAFKAVLPRLHPRLFGAGQYVLARPTD